MATVRKRLVHAGVRLQWVLKEALGGSIGRDAFDEVPRTAKCQEPTTGDRDDQ